MISVQSYVRRGKHLIRRWALDPRIHTAAQGAACMLSGFFLSAASLAGNFQPVAMGLVLALSHWSAVLAALGGSVGYLLFWGELGRQAVVWLWVGVLIALVLGDRRITRESPLLLPATAGLIVAGCGLAFQVGMGDTTPVAVYLLRVALGVGSTGLFTLALRGRNPVTDWLVCAVAVLALAQVMPIPYLGFGFVAAGMLAVSAPFPAAALAGLALDLAQITPVSMTAVTVMSFLVRLLPRYPKKLARLAPAVTCVLVMGLCDCWDWYPVPALLLGGMVGGFLPMQGKVAHRRGEIGVAQVRLEMASGVLAQTEQLLLETQEVPVDEDALVSRAAERACAGCPGRKGCKDARRIGQLPGPVLHKPLLSPEELPIICRKSGRFLAQLHRSQEQLRSIRADRERQREYRAAVVQQYQFLSRYLQELSDQLARRTDSVGAVYTPRVHIYGNRPEPDNGDRCLRFAGTMCKYYVLLCDGMGTGLGAVQEGRTAGQLLRRLLCAGYPAEHALQSLNSLCALRDRAGAVTVDLAELQLDSGRVVLYKWGAAPSYLLSKAQVEKIGTAGPPPGLSVTDCRQNEYRLTLRRDETLLLVSDGVGETQTLCCCGEMLSRPPGELAARLLTNCTISGEDDATVITVQLGLAN